MTTLNQIKKLLKNWFGNHKQVKHFFWGDMSDYNAIRDKEYVSVNVEYLETNLNQKMMNHSCRISIGDLVNPNYSDHEDEVISDTMLIAQDFFAKFETVEDFTLQRLTNIQPFSDTTTDRTAGVVFRIVLSVPRKANECAIPK